MPQRDSESLSQNVTKVINIDMNANKHTNDYPESNFIALTKPVGKTHTSSLVLRDKKTK